MDSKLTRENFNRLPFLCTGHESSVQFAIDKKDCNKSGIYRIRSIFNGKCYFGSAKKFRKRYWDHRNAVRRGDHHSPLLQRHANKYGENDLVFEIVEFCEKNVLIEREQFYLDTKQPFDKNGFNICRIADAPGSRIFSQEQRDKISKRVSGSGNPNFGKKASREKLFLMSKTTKIAKFSLDGKLMEWFENAVEAGFQTGFDKYCIRMACNCGIEKYKNFYWCYFDNDPPDTYPESCKVKFLEKKKINSESPIIRRKFGRVGREVVKFGLTGEFLEIYESLWFAARDNKLNSERIRLCCRKPHLFYGGHLWAYVK